MKVQEKKFQMISILLIICISFSLLNITNVKAAETKPTLWIKVHRIKALDYIEQGWFEGEADFRYRISVYNGNEWIYSYYTCNPNDNDVEVDYTHSFTLEQTTYIKIYIQVWEMDGEVYDQNVDIAKDTQMLDIYYNMKSNSVVGEYVEELGYLKTDGEWDGSEGTEIDENDAALWFLIWDNYESPVAYAGSDRTVMVGEKFNLDASRSTASIGSSLVQFQWDFENDGIYDAQGEQTSYTYTEKGVYTVKLKVTDSIGETNTDTCIVRVLSNKPKASFTYTPQEPTIQDTVFFYDTSNDPDGSVVSWTWDFGDGFTSTLKDLTHDYSDKGSYTVTLTVTDNDGNTDTIEEIITVLNLPPTADFTYSPSSPAAGKEVQFTDKSSDPEGKSLEYLWDFGDSTTSTKENPVHRYEEGGEYTIKLSVTDDEDDEDDIIKIVKILQTHDLTIEVKDILGLKIPNAEIELYSDGECCASGKTDTNGKLTFTEIAEGQYDIEVKVMGQTVSLTRSLSQPVTAQVQVTLSTNTLGITGGIVVIAALGGFYLMRRKKTTLPAEETNQEAESVSVVENDSLKEKKKELERERIAEILQTFKNSFEKGEMDEETYLRLKAKYEKELEELE